MGLIAINHCQALQLCHIFHVNNGPKSLRNVSSTFKAFGTPQWKTTISKWKKKAWHSSEPSQKWPTFQNSYKSIATTHPANHKWPKNNTGPLFHQIKVTVNYTTNFAKSPWWSANHLGEYFVDWWVESGTVWKTNCLLLQSLGNLQ